MDRHGFGEKTFRLDPAVRVIRGKHALDHYLRDTYNKIRQEPPMNVSDGEKLPIVWASIKK